MTGSIPPAAVAAVPRAVRLASDRQRSCGFVQAISAYDRAAAASWRAPSPHRYGRRPGRWFYDWATSRAAVGATDALGDPSSSPPTTSTRARPRPREILFAEHATRADPGHRRLRATAVGGSSSASTAESRPRPASMSRPRSRERHEDRRRHSPAPRPRRPRRRPDLRRRSWTISRVFRARSRAGTGSARDGDRRRREPWRPRTWSGRRRPGHRNVHVQPAERLGGQMARLQGGAGGGQGPRRLFAGLRSLGLTAGASTTCTVALSAPAPPGEDPARRVLVQQRRRAAGAGVCDPYRPGRRLLPSRRRLRRSQRLRR